MKNISPQIWVIKSNSGICVAAILVITFFHSLQENFVWDVKVIWITKEVYNVRSTVVCNSTNFAIKENHI